MRGGGERVEVGEGKIEGEGGERAEAVEVR